MIKTINSSLNLLYIILIKKTNKYGIKNKVGIKKHTFLFSTCYNEPMTNIKVIKTTNLAKIALENFAQNSNHLFITSTRSLNFNF